MTPSEIKYELLTCALFIVSLFGMALLMWALTVTPV